MIFDIDKTLPYNKIKKITDLFLYEHPECNHPVSIVHDYKCKHDAIGYFDPQLREIGICMPAFEKIIRNKKFNYPKDLNIYKGFSTLLLHELYHYKQFCDGHLYFKKDEDRSYYKDKPLSIFFLTSLEEYWKLPWEYDANVNVSKFTQKYKNELKKINRIPNYYEQRNEK